nr:MAG TPA: hypothetical protein [Bacteriophage sp.]
MVKLTMLITHCISYTYCHLFSLNYLTKKRLLLLLALTLELMLKKSKKKS